MITHMLVVSAVDAIHLLDFWGFLGEAGPWGNNIQARMLPTPSKIAHSAY